MSRPLLVGLVALVLVGAADAARAAAKRPAVAARAMVTSAHPEATRAGMEILAAGGNAMDAAVATAFAISVVEPFSAGIGGGGFLVSFRESDGVVESLDFRETAPAAATAGMYLDAAGKVRPKVSLDGALSVAVPGTVAGLADAHKKRGKLPWKRVLAPAIALARDGFLVTPRFVEAVEGRRDVLARFEASRAVFLPRAGEPPRAGDRLKQRDLHKTLEAIARDPRAFYDGAIGRAIARDVLANGGVLTHDDLRGYRPTWREPLCGTWRAWRLCTMAPPSSGGVHLLQILQLMDTPLLQADRPFHDVDTLHALIESMRIAYADRAVHLGDPAFVRVPTQELSSRAYADLRRKEIDKAKARRSTEVKAASPAELVRLAGSEHTSHLTVVDAERTAVSITFTVNYHFGSCMVAKGTGVLLNDEMDDFSAAPGVPNEYGLVGGEANAIAPKKIPLSSMTPLVVSEGGKLRMAAGAPGGSTIITQVLQLFLHVALYGLNASEAVAEPRVHHQWMPDVVDVEPRALDPSTRAALIARGHVLRDRQPWGNGNLVVVRPSDGLLEGAADPRNDGMACGHDALSGPVQCSP